jgi:hypothetical protein
VPKTSYITMDGDLVSEINPTSRLDYKRDALGSTTGTAGPSSATENEYRYKPYGALLSQSGTGVNPLFQWVGALGYRQTNRPHAESTFARGMWVQRRDAGRRLIPYGRTSLHTHTLDVHQPGTVMSPVCT